MLQIHRWFILVGIVFIVMICLSVDFRLDRLDSIFVKWKQEFLQKAKLQGISTSTLQAFDLLVKVPDKSILVQNNKDKNEVHSKSLVLTSIGKEVSLYLNDNLTLKAQLYYRDNFQKLEKYATEYGVAPHIIVSIFALGSEFGEKLNKYTLANVLATKSLVGSDKQFYEKELISLLKLVDLGYVKLPVKGDKDGTFTYLGINPSAYLYYGVDANKKGKVDLLSNKDDIYETAFYLINQLRFTHDIPLGYQVATNKNVSGYQGIKFQRSIKEWSELGVKNTNRLPYNKDDLNSIASFVAIDNNSGMLLLDNFNKILKTNNNLSKSVAITILANNLSEYAKQMAFKKLILQDNQPKKAKETVKKTKLDDIPVEKRLKNFINIK